MSHLSESSYSYSDTFYNIYFNLYLRFYISILYLYHYFLDLLPSILHMYVLLFSNICLFCFFNETVLHLVYKESFLRSFTFAHVYLMLSCETGFLSEGLIIGEELFHFYQKSSITYSSFSKTESYQMSPLVYTCQMVVPHSRSCLSNNRIEIIHITLLFCYFYQ